MKMRRKSTNLLMIFAMGVFFMLLYVKPLNAFAAEEEVAANILLSLTQDTTLMEEASADSNAMGTLPAGTPVISVEASANGWIKVMYQDMTGYIPLSSIGIEVSTELDAEFEQISNENKLIFEAVEYDKGQKRQKLMWGIVIAVLVVAIFTVGIISAVTSGKKKTNGEKHEANHTDTML